MFLITGANGQLGNELKKLLPTALAADIDILDITNENKVINFVKENHIDTIINCAAYTAVDKAENDEKLAELINVQGPKNLAKTGCRIVHISTDYVFDGSKNTPYTPEDMPHPVSVYGKTKLAGEKAVIENAEQAVIIRTAWLYSPYGNNFVKTMQRLGKERDRLNVVYDQVGTPTYAANLAEAIVKIIPQMCKENKGIYHFSNEGVCSWYDFAFEIMKKSGLNCKITPILSAQYPTAAKRPSYSVLDKSKIKETFGIEIQHWNDALTECLKHMD